MVGQKTLCRSHDAVIGGVCAGVAERFAIDTAVVRILTVALAFVTSGLAAVLYAVLWLILPKAPASEPVVDVTPEYVHSEAYGRPVDPRCSAKAAQTPGACPRSGIGHVPPVPPRSAAYAAQAAQTAYATHAVHATAPSASAAPYANPASTVHAAPSPAPSVPETGPAQPVREGSIRLMLTIGLVLLCFGFSAFFAGIVREVSWWQFWPLLFMLAGIVEMVVPLDCGSCRWWTIARGVVVFAFGGLLLFFSLGLVAWSSVPAVLDELWPLFFVMAGCFVIARSVCLPPIALCASAVFVLFCVLGLLWCGEPGDVTALTIELPGKAFSLANPWV